MEGGERERKIVGVGKERERDRGNREGGGQVVGTCSALVRPPGKICFTELSTERGAGMREGKRRGGRRWKGVEGEGN